MTAHDAPKPRKRGGNQEKNPKIDKDTEFPQEKELVYSIDHLNPGDS